MKTCCLSLLIILSLASCRKDAGEIDTAMDTVLELKPVLKKEPQGEPYTRPELDRIMLLALASGKRQHWDSADLKLTWSALQFGSHALSIGYQPVSVHNFEQELKTMNIRSDAYKKVHDALLRLILDHLQNRNDTISLRSFLIEDDPVLPVITIRCTDKVLLTKLSNLRNVRYLEASDYFPQALRSASGCGGSNEPLNGNDYSPIAPASLQPWNYTSATIPQAWQVTQGQGITVGVIDAGISSGQSLLGSQFTSGYSAGRSLTVGYTYGTTAYTSCVHGTSMCGLAAGPRNTLNATTGVAYRSSLFFLRACDDVVLTSSSEKLSVKNALVFFGNSATVRVISMSIGTPFSSSVLKDGVDYAYARNKIIFAAAGTSYTWTSWYGVIYPAAYNSCIAVTGIREDGSTCSTCHDGPEVQFTVVMERTPDNDRNTLSLAPVFSAPTYVGGSSSATATAAGIAALVWSAKPLMTRDQLYNCLRNTSQYFPFMDAEHGYGKLNAYNAILYAQRTY